jgi:hypothetical protein
MAKGKEGQARMPAADAVKDHFELIWRQFDEFARAAIAGLDESLDPAALLVCISNIDGGRVEVFAAPAIARRLASRFASASREAFDRPPSDDAPVSVLRGVQRRLDHVQKLVEERLTSWTATSRHVWLAGRPSDHDRFTVAPVLRLNKRVFQSHHRLSGAHPQSLVEAVANLVLSEAHDAISRPDQKVFPVGAPQIVQQAGRDLFGAALAAVSPAYDAMLAVSGLDPFASVDRISTIRHEGKEAQGRIVIAEQQRVQIQVQWNPVPLHRIEWVRKLLQLSTGRYSLMSDGFELFGLGSIRRDTPAAEKAFFVDFLGSHTWELRQGKNVLMRVMGGLPRLAHPRLDEKHFRKELRSLLGEVRAYIVWRLVERAIDRERGTTIVVSKEAEAEAKRLGMQATPIVPRRATPELMDNLTSLDGAVLLDTQGVCYAIGVILDGMAKEHLGDPSRGARYNSAVRYVSGRAPRSCVVVVISEDGKVDVIPHHKKS